MNRLDTVAREVYEYLLNVPETRDSDRYLLYLIWGNQIQKPDDLLDSLKDGKVTHPETIRRVRQKLQEKNVKLRGESWDRRHGYQTEVKGQLNFLDKLGMNV